MCMCVCFMRLFSIFAQLPFQGTAWLCNGAQPLGLVRKAGLVKGSRVSVSSGHATCVSFFRAYKVPKVEASYSRERIERNNQQPTNNSNNNQQPTTNNQQPTNNQPQPQPAFLEGGHGIWVFGIFFPLRQCVHHHVHLYGGQPGAMSKNTSAASPVKVKDFEPVNAGRRWFLQKQVKKYPPWNEVCLHLNLPSIFRANSLLVSNVILPWRSRKVELTVGLL